MNLYNSKVISEINIVPYVDVVLVLLVVFMVTTPLLNQGIEVNLPTANATPMVKNDNATIIVSVAKNGEFFLNIADNPNTPVKSQNLIVRVSAALQINSSRAVVVRGDKDVSYDTVLQVMVLLQQAGVSNIGLETKYK